MKFKSFILMEADPMGGGMPMPGAGGGGAPPPMGGGMGAPPGGAPGGDPMGGAPMGGGMPMPAPSEPPAIPKYADIWDVLDSLLNHKPLEQEEKMHQQKANPPAPPPMPGMGGPPAPPGPPPMPGMGGPPAPPGPLLMQ